MSGDGGKGSDFWSRRKAAVKKAEEAERAEKEADSAAEARAELEQKTDEEILEDLGLPDPDALTADDDFSGFLSAAVPERLRRRALRRLWGLNPVLANLDGLVEYAEDYTDAATVIDNLQTVYQVGKGMLEQFAEAEEKINETVANLEDATKNYAGETNLPVKEEDIAPHNDLVENETTSVQLTPSDDLVQSHENKSSPAEDQEAEGWSAEEVPQSVRRRLRFDYT